MNLDLPDFLTSAELGDDYYRMVLYGRQGTGKTRLASTIGLACPTLLIDLLGERGVRSFKGTPQDKNIKIARPTSVQQFDDLFHYLRDADHPYGAVVLDSMSALQKMATRFAEGHSETMVREIRMGASGSTFQTYGQSLGIITDLATFWFGLADAGRKKPMHVIMTAQEKLVEEEATGDKELAPDLQKGAIGIALAAPDYVLRTSIEDNQEAYNNPDLPPTNYLVQIGPKEGMRTKARLPGHLSIGEGKGKIPPVLGRKSSANLITLGRVLGVGGIPAAPKAAAK